MLDGQTVRVPASLARHIVATHCLVAREYILEAARQHMVDARLAICSWRAFVKAELRIALGRLERFGKHVILTPERQHLGFEIWPVVSTCYFFKRQDFNSPKRKRPGRQRLAPGAKKSRYHPASQPLSKRLPLWPRGPVTRIVGQAAALTCRRHNGISCSGSDSGVIFSRLVARSSHPPPVALAIGLPTRPHRRLGRTVAPTSRKNKPALRFSTICCKLYRLHCKKLQACSLLQNSFKATVCAWPTTRKAPVRQWFFCTVFRNLRIHGATSCPPSPRPVIGPSPLTSVVADRLRPLKRSVPMRSRNSSPILKACSTRLKLMRQSS